VIEYIVPGPLTRSEAWTRLLRYVGHWAMLPYVGLGHAALWVLGLSQEYSSCCSFDLNLNGW
jgi:hypothetical protein